MANTAVFGIYPTFELAESAVGALKAEGFRATDISVLLPENVGSKDLAHTKASKAPEGADHIRELVLAPIPCKDREKILRDLVEAELVANCREGSSGLFAVDERARRKLRQIPRIGERLRKQVQASADRYDLPFVARQVEQSGCVAPR